MQRIVVTCAALLLAAGAVAGCGPDPEVVAEQQREEQWQQIEQTRQDLSAKRAELEQASHQAAMEPEGEEGDETAGEESGEGAAAEGDPAGVEALKEEATKLAEQLDQQLVEFINANAPVVGEAPPELVQQAIRIRSDEYIRGAQEWIEEGGDYRAAIRNYEAALEADPDYEALKELLAEAEEMRFMSEERFAKVEHGMNEDQVREAIGQVNLRNTQKYDNGKTLAWFYPRDDRGSAAAVWFRKNRQGAYEVYEADFHYADKNGEEGEG